MVMLSMSKIIWLVNNYNEQVLPKKGNGTQQAGLTEAD